MWLKVNSRGDEFVFQVWVSVLCSPSYTCNFQADHRQLMHFFKGKIQCHVMVKSNIQYIVQLQCETTLQKAPSVRCKH